MSTERTRHIVITDQSHGLPYSKGLMASSLMASGLPATDAFRIAERIERTLTEEGKFEVTSQELRQRAASLLAEVGERFASSYLKWQAVEELDVPLVILLGGATGVGKSTIATQLAARLGITRVISTDAIREVLRSAFSRELMPTLHESSFSAHAALRAPLPPATDALLIGFQEQVSAVAVGVKALIARAIEEGTDMIIEGAHVVPGFLDGWEEEFGGAVLVPIVMVVTDEALHQSHFHLRTLETRSSRHDRYLSVFVNIRAIQSHIQQLAAQRDIPVIEAFDLDSTLQQVISLVVEKALARVQEGRGATSAAPAAIEVDEERELVRRPKSGRLRSWEILAGRRRGN